MIRLLLVLTCSLGFLVSSTGHAASYSFSNSGSRITFDMSSSLHDFQGKVDSFTGTLDGDAGTGALSIDATSLTTELGPRDTKMHEFCLESSKFSTISFDVKSITGDLAGLQSGSGSGKIVLNGNLTIRDMYVEENIETDYSFEDGVLTLRGSLRTSWKDLGVPDPSIIISKLDPSMKVKFKLKLK
jgi:polyisoprenoid-binding protein YceI